MTMPRATKAFWGLTCLACLLLADGAWAQLAPAPQKAPRTPVKKEVLSGSKAPLPASRTIEGPATILDSERLKIDDVEVRLFGVVPPQLSASFGPQARHVVDALAQGDVTCRIRDRDRDGRFLASCRNSDDADFGIELLRRGLAVTARGSLRPTELARPYIAAEEAAKSQRLGLWSVALPKAASEQAIREAAQKSEEDKKEKAKAQEPVKEEPVKEAAKASPPPVQETPAVQEPVSSAASSTSAPVAALASTPAASVAESKEKLGDPSLGPSAEDIQKLLNPPAIPVETAEKGLLEKYQLLFVGFLALATALVWAGTTALFRSKEKRDELRAIAAALRGEMMAARAICLARLSKIANDKDEKGTSWPRLRSLVFQAYVGQLGRLGADLSRQIASIYGQASDYASYYVGAEAKPEAASKQQSLQTLVQHIEEVVPRLSEIEEKGRILSPSSNQPLPASLLARVVRPASLTPLSPTDGGPGRPESLPAPDKEESAAPKSADAGSPPEEIRAASPKPEQKPTEKPVEKNAEAAKLKPAARKTIPQQHKAAATAKPKPQTHRAYPTNRFEETTDLLVDIIKKIDIKTSVQAHVGRLKTLAAGGWQKLGPQPYEDVIPDYANLTEEEIEALSYIDDDYFMPPETDRRRKTG